MEAKPRLQRLASAAILAAGLLALVHSLAWRGARFPGFFLMPNRVVPSVALEGVAASARVVRSTSSFSSRWTTSRSPTRPRATGRRRATPPASRCATSSRVASSPRRGPSRSASWATASTWRSSARTSSPASPISCSPSSRPSAGAWAPFRGLAAFGWAGAAFSFTGMDLYGPGQMFRLHVLAEAILPAAAAHLALTCPRDHLARRPGLFLVGYGVALVLAAIYELFLYDPSAYTVIHDLCQSLSIVPVLAFTVALGLAVGEPPAELGALAVRRLLVGAVAGIVLPAVVLAVSGVSGGLVPVNVTAWVGFVFPLAALATFRLRPAALAVA